MRQTVAPQRGAWIIEAISRINSREIVSPPAENFMLLLASIIQALGCGATVCLSRHCVKIDNSLSSLYLSLCSQLPEIKVDFNILLQNTRMLAHYPGKHPGTRSDRLRFVGTGLRPTASTNGPSSKRQPTG